MKHALTVFLYDSKDVVQIVPPSATKLASEDLSLVVNSVGKIAFFIEKPFSCQKHIAFSINPLDSILPTMNVSETVDPKEICRSDLLQLSSRVVIYLHLTILSRFYRIEPTIFLNLSNASETFLPSTHLIFCACINDAAKLLAFCERPGTAIRTPPAGFVSMNFA